MSSLPDRDTYYATHTNCPNCGSKDIESTCVGMFPPDTNKARCFRCKWKGVVDNLVQCSSLETKSDE